MTKAATAIAELETLFARAAETLGKLRTSDDWVDQHHSPLGKRKHLALVRSGELVGHKVDRLVLVRREDLDAFITRHRVDVVSKSDDEQSAIEEIARPKVRSDRRRRTV